MEKLTKDIVDLSPHKMQFVIPQRNGGVLFLTTEAVKKPVRSPRSVRRQQRFREEPNRFGVDSFVGKEARLTCGFSESWKAAVAKGYRHGQGLTIDCVEQNGRARLTWDANNPYAWQWFERREWRLKG